MQIQEFWVKRDTLRTTLIETVEAADLAEGEVRLAVDKFALTANNVSYAVSGDMIGYWKFFPAQGDWGKVPVWGFADVVESRCPELKVGERIWGFLPMATHLTVMPGKVDPAQFIDFTPHRKELPGLYNLYFRADQDPAPLKAMEDERCLLFPLFATSFLLYDYLIDNGFFGAEQVLVGSASSKTGFGLAEMLHRDPAVSARVIGLTSPANVDFVKGLDVCDQVVAYQDITTLDPAVASAFVDMAGEAEVTTAVHGHFREQLRESCLVGATHWESKRRGTSLPGAKPHFFFAPGHVQKREQEWGAGEAAKRAFGAAAQTAMHLAHALKVEHSRGPEAVQARFLALLDNQVAPSRGLMLSMNS